MTRKTAQRRKSLYIAAAGILLVGWATALSVYMTVENVSDNVLGYGLENGTPYRIAPEDTKMYSRSLELYGGKANVLMDEFRHWFAGLWQGQTLAYTIACCTLILVIGLLFVAHWQPQDQEPDVRDTDNRD